MNFKNISACVMGTCYVLAGVNHFIHEDFYVKMMPSIVPLPREMVWLTGIAEIVLGIGVFFASTRKTSAWGIIVLLILIFPANINMALHAAEWDFSPTGLYLRLPVQLLFLAWACWYTK